jgi:hypothetical protein
MSHADKVDLIAEHLGVISSIIASISASSKATRKRDEDIVLSEDTLPKIELIDEKSLMEMIVLLEFADAHLERAFEGLQSVSY